MKWALKMGVLSQFLGPAMFLMRVVFIVWLRTVESLAPWSLHLLHVCPAPLSALGYLLEEEGVVFTLKKTHTDCPGGE